MESPDWREVFTKQELADAMSKYKAHRKNAKAREVDFKISFDDWMDIWWKSGQWGTRGRGQSVMMRFGDLGAYEVGNVRIGTQSQNAKEANIGAKRPRQPDYVSPLLGRPLTEQHKQAVSRGAKGRKPPNLGKPMGEAQKEKLSVIAKTIVECPHCGKQGGNRIMLRWHFGNCKFKT